jgi:hypothetical protein
MTSLSSIESPTQTEHPPRILVNSIPKAGTHLLEKVLHLLPEFTSSGLHIDQFVRASTIQYPLPKDEVGDPFVEAPKADFVKLVLRIPPGQYATSHLIYSEPISEALDQAQITLLGIIRDPRDIVVSFTKYVASQNYHYLFNDYNKMSLEEQLSTTIIGIPELFSEYISHLPILMDINSNVRSYLGWSHYLNAYVTTFEKLVGSQGGGSDAAQLIELRNITAHVGASYNDDQLDELAQNLFGGSATFRKGLVGDWQNYFTPAHKSIFKKIAGQLLIDLGYESNLDW